MNSMKIIMTLLALFYPIDTLAEDLLPLHFAGVYDFDWSGIKLGQLVLGVDETPDHYNMHLVVASEGIVNIFTRHVSDTVVNGKRTAHGYLPEYYESYYKTKQKPRHIRLTFDAKGAVKEELNEPPEDRSDRPEVPHNLKDGSYDPLTLLMALRAGAREAHGFDAKRLYYVHAQDGGRDNLYIEGKWRKAFSLVLTRTPLGGLTAKETMAYKKGEPPLSLYFSNDKDRIPLAVSMKLFFGEMAGVLTRECKTWQECAIPVNVK